jgi:hypothetical protein
VIWPSWLASPASQAPTLAVPRAIFTNGEDPVDGHGAVVVGGVAVRVGLGVGVWTTQRLAPSQGS